MRRGTANSISVILVVLAVSCGGDDRRRGADAAVRGDASTSDAGTSDSGAADSGGVDASRTDAGMRDAVCDTADARGSFASCTPCLGGDCETIDVSGSIRYVCGCTSGCPCGLSCGSIEIAPGVTVGNVCVR